MWHRGEDGWPIGIRRGRGASRASRASVAAFARGEREPYVPCFGGCVGFGACGMEDGGRWEAWMCGHVEYIKDGVNQVSKKRCERPRFQDQRA